MLYTVFTFLLTHSFSPYVIFFFNDTATTEIYTLSLHDALPISPASFTTPADAVSPSHFRVLMEISSTRAIGRRTRTRSEEHTSERQSHQDLVCRLLLEKKNHKQNNVIKLQSNNT